MNYLALLGSVTAILPVMIGSSLAQEKTLTGAPTIVVAHRGHVDLRGREVDVVGGDEGKGLGRRGGRRDPEVNAAIPTADARHLTLLR